MKANQIYAVVDIETTGTDPSVDRMIQFGCVLVQDGAIISQFATDINPNQAIPKQIEKLTGVTNAQVRKAPYFEDVAWTIHHLLADTVFVAHNVHFDYTFLSHELARCGAPKLTMPGIDTVELAQVFLPTERSFRLGDLANSLGFVHENPHQADSDAYVTAELFLLIEEKIGHLPLVTLENLTKLSHKLAMDTDLYLAWRYEVAKKANQPLDSAYRVVAGLALRKQSVPLFEEPLHEVPGYPKTKRAKEKLLRSHLEYRPEQARLMNIVYKHFTEGTTKNLFVEAATGSGKTLGYLLPTSYVATPEEPAIISTASILLQEQLLTQAVTKTNQLVPRPLRAVMVKGQRHYLDLQRFKATLQKLPAQKQTALYQMSLLVWLLQTETGDLDEVPLAKLEHPFFQLITHRGLAFLAPNDALYQVDFLRLLYQRMAQSNVLIVNHAFLVQESLREQPVLPASPYLIIDEAHHLPDTAAKIAQQHIQPAQLKKHFQLLKEKEATWEQVKELMAQQPELVRLLTIYERAFTHLMDKFRDFFYELQQSVGQPITFGTAHLLTKDKYEQLSTEGAVSAQALQVILTELVEIQTRFWQNIRSDFTRFTASDRVLLAKVRQFFDEVAVTAPAFDRYINDWQPRFVKEYQLFSAEQGTLHIHDLAADLLPETKWYARYDKIIYTGGTLRFGQDTHFLRDELGVSEAGFQTLPNPYDYAQQTQIYVPNDLPALHTLSTEEAAAQLADFLKALAQQQARPFIVLFTSLELLERVYYRLNQEPSLVGRELLAQGHSGSREKIVKRFRSSTNGILLGADSFWEGIDLPGRSLELVVVTRLPFEPPQRPLVKARHAYLQEQGFSPFTKETLPKAALRLRQALGRLIRSPQDRGALIILDTRFLTASYGKKLQQALPKAAPIKAVSQTELLTGLAEFFAQTAENPPKEQ